MPDDDLRTPTTLSGRRARPHTSPAPPPGQFAESGIAGARERDGSRVRIRHSGGARDGPGFLRGLIIFAFVLGPTTTTPVMVLFPGRTYARSAAGMGAWQPDDLSAGPGTAIDGTGSRRRRLYIAP